MALCHYFKKQVPEVLHGPLSMVLSPAMIRHANMAVKQCADLVSQAAVKPRGNYVKYTPEDQAVELQIYL